MNLLRIQIAVLLSFILLATSLQGTPADEPSLNIKGDIMVEGIIKPGEVVTIFFNFELISSGETYDRMKEYFENANDADKAGMPSNKRWESISRRFDTAYIYADEALEFITPFSWRGRLIPGKMESIITKAIIKSSKPINIIGAVGTCCDLLPKDIGEYGFSCVTFNSVAVKALNIELSKDADMPDFDTIRFQTGDSILIRNIINNNPPPDSNIIIKTLPVPPPRKLKNIKQLNELIPAQTADLNSLYNRRE